ncbi:sirohydrochlorin ferrochelatase [Marisediminicola sp. UYEF4]|uniref:sirohydrochlorin chelatase n=1 Tax=Marisediminicola sp. UYEF4 TaxID=1756384 RepID=UPI0033922A5B
MSAARPVLVAASHGTSDPVGDRAVAALVRAVVAAKPHTMVLGSFVDVQHPSVPESIAAIEQGRSVVIVPLLLSAGFHVRVDLRIAARDAAPRPVTVTGALGPDARLAEILASRLDEVGLRAGDRVVLGAAGSSDAHAVADCHLMGRLLAERLGRPVSVGFLSAVDPALSAAVAAERAAAPGARVVVANFLLAPGYFDSLARAAGADVVTAPLLAAGEHPPALLVDVVSDLYDAAACSGRAAAESDGHVSSAYQGSLQPVTKR